MRKKILFVSLMFMMNIISQINNIDYQVINIDCSSTIRHEINIPDILGYKTLKGDLHIHTIFSDGVVTPQERVLEAWCEGLDFIAITDHNTPLPKFIQGDYNTSYKLAKPIAESLNITLIPGIEYTDSKPIGHFNFLFIDDANKYSRERIEPREAVEEAVTSGAFVVYNHPGWPDKNSDLFPFQIDLLNQQKIHAIEVINSHEFYPRSLIYCKEYNLTPISSTDIHGVSPYRFKTKEYRNMTLVFAEENTQAAIKDALFAGRAIAYANGLLAGKSCYLKALLKSSLQVCNLKKDAFYMEFDVKNNTDFTYQLDGKNQATLLFPSNTIRKIKLTQKELLDIYQLRDAYIGANEQLSLPLASLFTPDDECEMPYMESNQMYIQKGESIKLIADLENPSIYYTLDGSEPTTESQRYITPITLKSSSVLKARSFKTGKKPSEIFEKQLILEELHKASRNNLTQNGVYYTYYEGTFDSVNQFNTKGEKRKNGIIPSINLSVAEIPDHFGIVFSGYIYIPQDGSYTFATYSDDGSTFKISGVNLIDNDGSHGLTKVSGTLLLQKGFHPYELCYMEDYEGQELHLLWKTPNGIEHSVPIENLFIE